MRTCPIPIFAAAIATLSVVLAGCDETSPATRLPSQPAGAGSVETQAASAAGAESQPAGAASAERVSEARNPLGSGPATASTTTAGRPVDGMSAAIAGRNLSTEQIQELELLLEREPDDFDAHARLLGHYFTPRFGSDEARAAQEKHALWLIEKHPESDLAGAPFAGLDKIMQPQAYARGRDLWLNHCQSQPENAGILGNAASFFTIHDRSKAIELLERAQQIEPSNPQWPQRLGHLHSLGRVAGMDDRAAADRALDAYERSLERATGKERFYVLAEAAKSALSAGDKAKARAYATELLDLSVQAERDWNYGNAVHHGNLVLGQLALAEGDVEAAETFLLQAGRTPGSPQLNSFGPNMVLAKALLDAGRTEAVIEYLDLCAVFWKMHRGKLDQWKKEIATGEIPEFGANLKY